MGQSTSFGGICERPKLAPQRSLAMSSSDRRRHKAFAKRFGLQSTRVMKRFSVHRSVSIWILLALTACGETLQKDVCNQMNFAFIDIESVTEIRLHKTNGLETSENTIASLSAKDEVSAVHRFLMSNESDWTVDPFGVPVGSYRVIFWSESTRFESVSFGP